MSLGGLIANQCELVGVGSAITPATDCQGGAPTNATTADVLTEAPMPVAATVVTFYVETTVAASAGNQIAYTLRLDNGCVNNSPTCDPTGAGGNGGQTVARCTPAPGSFGCGVNVSVPLQFQGFALDGSAEGLMDVLLSRGCGGACAPPSPGVVTWSVEYQ